MKKLISKLAFAATLPVLVVAAASCGEKQEALSSPSGNIRLTFGLDKAGQPVYSVVFDDEEIIRPSTLGFEVVDGPRIAEGFRIDNVSRTSSDSYWTPVWGENDSIRDHYNAMTVAMTNGEGIKMDVEFRVFDDGAAFRYIFPEQDTKTIRIKEELTQMAMGGDYTAWWIPGDYDTQEYEYNKSKLSEIRSFSDGDKMGNVAQTAFSPTGVQKSEAKRS